MRKLFLVIALCALGACTSDSNSTSSSDGGGGDGKDAGGTSEGDDGGNGDDVDAGAGSQLTRPPGALERPAKSGLPADLRPPKD